MFSIMNHINICRFGAPGEAYLSGEFGEDPIGGMFKYTGLSPDEAGEHYSSDEHARWLEYRKHLGLDKKYF